MERVLVTGANGFVGQVLCQLLVDKGISVKAVVRSSESHAGSISIGEINGDTNWQDALIGIDCVVHLAARVHVMNESAANPLNAFRHVNTAGSEKLARDAAKAGVKRLIYLSTIKVNGEQTYGVPFNEKVEHTPVDPYALSKWEAENSLRRISIESGMEIVIIRAPLVYGPGVKGNFLTLLKLVSKGLPLPFASVKNKRSLVALSNLVDLIRECIVNPRAAGEIFLVSDGEDLSTAELIKVIALKMGKPSRLIPIPLPLLNVGATIIGKRSVARRLLGSLQVDSSSAHRVLGWVPPYSVEHEIDRVVDWHREKNCSEWL